MSGNHLKNRRPLVDPELDRANRIRQLVADADAGRVPTQTVTLPFASGPIDVVLVTPNQIDITTAFARAREAGGDFEAQASYMQFLLPRMIYATYDEEQQEGHRLIRGDQDEDLWRKIQGTPALLNPLFAAALGLINEASKLGQAEGEDPNASRPDSSASGSGTEQPNAGQAIGDLGTPSSTVTSFTLSGPPSSSEPSVSQASESGSPGS